MRLGIVLLLSGLGLSAPAAAQLVLNDGDVGVVTSDGFFLVSGQPTGQLPTHHVPASAWGATSLIKPAVAWEPGTDSFLVCTADRLLRLTIEVGTTTITDLSPTLAPGAALVELDLHPGTGQLVLLDDANDEALFFSPPFAAGMSPEASLGLDPTARSICFDVVDYPPSVIYPDSTRVERSSLAGMTSPVTELPGATDVAVSPQIPGNTHIVKATTSEIEISTNSPMLTVSLNVIGFCAPVALKPRSVALRPGSGLTYVLAAGGLNPVCYPGVLGKNHIVSFPPAQGPIPISVVTNTNGSGITGNDGDIAPVGRDVAFSSPYGLACMGSTGKTPQLLALSAQPSPGQDFFTLDVKGAPPLAPVLILVGLVPVSVPLGSGCTLLVLPFTNFLGGVTNVNGKLTVPAGIPAAVPLGSDYRVQGVVQDGNGAVLTNGLLVHVSIP